MKTGFTLIELIVLLLICFVCIALGWSLGTNGERGRLKNEAVEVGVAHYEVDAKGNTKCVWDVKESVLTVTNRLILK